MKLAGVDVKANWKIQVAPTAWQLCLSDCVTKRLGTCNSILHRNMYRQYVRYPLNKRTEVRNISLPQLQLRSNCDPYNSIPQQLIERSPLRVPIYKNSILNGW